MANATLNVKGMTCGGCENAVRRVVSTIPGVASVTASHVDERVEVDYDPARADMRQIADAIRTAGYDVVT